MAPTVAVSDLLKQTGLALQDFDYYEIHEAFAAQVLATLKAWESDRLLPPPSGTESGPGADRPGQAQRQGLINSFRSSFCGHGGANCRGLGQAPA